MGKTIDVKGWPPGGGDPAGSRWDGKNLKAPPLVVMAAALFGVLAVLVSFMGLTGRLGVASIEPRELGVVVNYLTGARKIVTTPGYCFYMPFVEEVFLIDKSQQRFIMEGSRYVDDNHVPRLTVRASDGSSFYFEEMPIQYQVRPEMADLVLRDSGPGDGYKEEWVKAHARSILRDEFGRLTAVEAANPTEFDQARMRARERLNDALEPHGIEVVLIGTPNPKFDQAYEEAIEERKSADQEVERLEAEQDQLVQERDQNMAEVEREQSVAWNALLGDLQKSKLAAEVRATQARKAAEAYSQERHFAAEAEKAQRLAMARGLEAKYRNEAEGILSRAKALEQRGEVVVREAIIQKLAGIKFTLVPYSRDPAPKRLEHTDAREGARRDEMTLDGGQD